MPTHGAIVLKEYQVYRGIWVRYADGDVGKEISMTTPKQLSELFDRIGLLSPAHYLEYFYSDAGWRKRLHENYMILKYPNMYPQREPRTPIPAKSIMPGTRLNWNNRFDFTPTATQCCPGVAFSACWLYDLPNRKLYRSDKDGNFV